MKRLFFTLLSLFIISQAKSQCYTTLSFTYTQGAGGNVTFTPNVAGGTAPYTYEWIFGNDSIGSVQPNPTFTFPANYTYNVCLLITDFNRCTDSVCLPVQVTTSTTYTCPGTAAFTYAQNGSAYDFTFGSAAVYRKIDFGDGLTKLLYGATLVTHSYPLNGTYTVSSVSYSLFGSFVIPCDTFTQTITVNNVSCHADFGWYVDTSRGTRDLYLYNLSKGDTSNRWYLNGLLVASDTSDVFLPSLPPGALNMCLTVFGPGGCADSICYTDSIAFVYRCSGVSFSYSGLTSPCDAYQFTTTNTGSPLTSVDWYEDGVLFSSLASPTHTFNFSSSTTDYAHIVKVSAQGTACYADTAFFFFHPAGYEVTAYDSTLHIWYLTPTPYNGIASVQWDFGDGTTSTQLYPTHQYASPGFYNVCRSVTLTNGCVYQYCYNGYFYRQDESAAVVQIVVLGPTGVAELMKDAEVKLFPNPASNQLTLTCDKPFTPNTSIKLFNALGQVMNKLSVKESTGRVELNVKSYAAGVYFLSIEENGVVSMHKFLISK